MPFNKVMHKFKHGQLHSGSKHGPKVKKRSQAIAIMLDEKRKADEGDEEYKADPDNDGDTHDDTDSNDDGDMDSGGGIGPSDDTVQEMMQPQRGKSKGKKSLFHKRHR